MSDTEDRPPRPALNSIYNIKNAFLVEQVNQLGLLQEPSPNWNARSAQDEDNDIPQPVLSQVYFKLGLLVRKHQKLVYSAQVLRAVAEQLDTLYWEDGDSLDGADRPEKDALKYGADLTDPKVIERLPPVFPSDAHDEHELLPKYLKLCGELKQNASTLNTQREKHAYYSRLREVVRPFSAPLDSVQPNILIGEGGINAELENSKILAAKLAAQIDKVGLASPAASSGQGAGEGLRALIGADAYAATR